MKLHRFYLDADLTQKFWFDDKRIFNQIKNVLRLVPGSDISLFNQHSERIYKISRYGDFSVLVDHVTDIATHKPKRKITLIWSLLKKDKNDWILQKATELGVSHFVPVVSDRTEKTGFDIDRALKIIIEAVEQCGRIDLPSVREPRSLKLALNEHKNSTKMYICEQSDDMSIVDNEHISVVVGPEGGWSDQEKEIFKQLQLAKLNLSQFTLRAGTASIVALSKLL